MMRSTTFRRDDWFIQSIEHREAAAFIERWHYAKGAANTSVCRFGLLHTRGSGVLWGVSMWMPPTRIAAESVDPEWRGVLCLSRFAIHPLAPKNAASFLLGGSMRMIDRERWPVLLTYADTRLGHGGGIYRATNWVEVGKVPAGDVWVDPEGRQAGRKRGKKNYSAAEMREMGYVKMPPLPKIKFVHRNIR